MIGALTIRAVPLAQAALDETARRLLDALASARLVREHRAYDSPLYQLLNGLTPLRVPSDRTDVFRDQVAYAEARKAELAKARAIAKTSRKDAQAAVLAVRQSVGKLDAVEAGVAIDLLLSFRAASDWPAMISLVADMPSPLRATAMVQEQLGFALSRNRESEEAEKVLLELIAQRGSSSETLGILGRVYKDRWETAKRVGDFAAPALLEKAIDAYRRGFETDWRDHYPGINAVTLMEINDPPDPERLRLIPVVRYSVERRIASGKPDYWDWATLLEIEVLGRDRRSAETALSKALTCIRELFEPETTANNLRLIREAREGRNEADGWALTLENELMKRVPPKG